MVLCDYFILFGVAIKVYALGLQSLMNVKRPQVNIMNYVFVLCCTTAVLLIIVIFNVSACRSLARPVKLLLPKCAVVITEACRE